MVKELQHGKLTVSVRWSVPVLLLFFIFSILCAGAALASNLAGTPFPNVGGPHSDYKTKDRSTLRSNRKHSAHKKSLLDGQGKVSYNSLNCVALKFASFVKESLRRACLCLCATNNYTVLFITIRLFLPCWRWKLFAIIHQLFRMQNICV